ncbi:hypothetical protein CORC01_00390 [Colletotrichum orchidophilum]|uniref:Uncharacterized protein n=1 Tax=Colletotrichum orchidophilum TaxID=1209926 RepID=A0A1G4BRN4_9PEZI|nr:uncharacterized protein CORC01_00390 [Colletotrichum orchidophilum]OHF04051.1 hypothetical protein CORC01_00390 [Colletotrichum orchidophilum]
MLPPTWFSREAEPNHPAGTSIDGHGRGHGQSPTPIPTQSPEMLFFSAPTSASQPRRSRSGDGIHLPRLQGPAPSLSWYPDRPPSPARHLIQEVDSKFGPPSHRRRLDEFTAFPHDVNLHSTRLDDVAYFRAQEGRWPLIDSLYDRRFLGEALPSETASTVSVLYRDGYRSAGESPPPLLYHDHQEPGPEQDQSPASPPIMLNGVRVPPATQFYGLPLIHEVIDDERMRVDEDGDLSYTGMLNAEA